MLEKELVEIVHVDALNGDSIGVHPVGYPNKKFQLNTVSPIEQIRPGYELHLWSKTPSVTDITVIDVFHTVFVGGKKQTIMCKLYRRSDGSFTEWTASEQQAAKERNALRMNLYGYPPLTRC